MKKILVAGVITLASAGIVACTPGHNVPGATAAGAVAGGVLGSAFFHGRGSFAGVVGGALIGGIVGNMIGRHMDKQDRINMQSAIVETPVGRKATWHNQRRDVTYTVEPVRQYHRRGHVCRRYKTVVMMGKWDKPRYAYGTACKNPNTGKWYIVNNSG